MNRIVISYRASVLVGAGWRSIEVTAKAVTNKTGKMASVAEVIAIDGDFVSHNMSRTGANRQKYNGEFVARREVGARKRLSSCEILENCSV